MKTINYSAMLLYSRILFLTVVQLAVVRGFFIFDGFNYLYNEYYAKCTGWYFKKNINGLEYDLKLHLYGQPLVKDIVVHSIRGHLDKEYPKKSLVLSFHGWTGSGKNYVADFIVKHLFREGVNSPNVHLFTRHNFELSDRKSVFRYQVEMVKTIKDSVKRCKNSIFIFDEVEKYPEGVLDNISPFLDYNLHIDFVDYRHAIFIFLSNIGGNEIVKKTIELWKSGVDREKFKLKDFQSNLITNSFSTSGGFYKSDLIANNLIDHYIPFLPLEEKHVRLCIDKELQNMRFNEPVVVEKVLEDLEFGPEPEKIFSVAGCKRISQLVSTYAQRSLWKNEL